MKPPHIPRCSYRIQLNRGFTFAQATEIVPYLARLGISHVYCSPYLKARAGSAHGYDVVDHNALNPEIGSAEEYERFVATLAANDMGQMVDLVPNHMGVGGDDNTWWLNVLENGQASDYAEFFDIDWQSVKPELRGKVLLPFLEDHYGKVLDRGLLKLEFDATRGEFSVRYYEHRLPLDPKTYPRVLGPGLEALDSQDEAVVACRGLVSLLDGLPSRLDAAPERRAQRNRDQRVLKQRLAELAHNSSIVATFLQDAVRRYNGAPGEAASYDHLHALLEEQSYRPAYWRVAADEINYRRFFDINALAALRVERPEVFAATHRLVLDLVAQGKVHALRIDHPDGLYDPAGYFRAVREAIAARGGEGDAAIYMVAEKILIPPEPLPESWQVDGTTGYDFANQVNGLFVHPEGEAPFTQLYARVVGDPVRFSDLLYESRKLVMRTLMSGELMVLANLLDRISEADRRTRDHTLHALRDALMEVIACFPVYRTYVTGAEVSEQDRRFVSHAILQARRRSPTVDVSVFQFLRSVLLLEDPEDRHSGTREALADFVRKLQQYTSPVMAKGFEDTSFYVYNRFVALNEVGGDPRRFGLSAEDFHNANAERRAHWPHSMLCTSSHDTKRSEDVRARLTVLSEIPGEWRSHVLRWIRLNRDKKREVGGELAPDGNDEYMLYQALLGIWPLEAMDAVRRDEFQMRIESYLLKAVREAKRHTSWINLNEEYEAALIDFARAILAEDARNRFLTDFTPFAQHVARFGFYNSLSQTLFKLTVPGVPDIYQGTEVWDFSLVDPDNRRPVDYGKHLKYLTQLEVFDSCTVPEQARQVQQLLESSADGRAKLHLVRRVLRQRRLQEALFRDGSYEPLVVIGDRAAHLCAFIRHHENDAILTAAGRWYARLPSAGEILPLGEAVWGDNVWVCLPLQSPWREAENVLTGERLEVASHNGKPGFPASKLFAHFPVALLLLR